MKDRRPAERYQRYVNDRWTWLPILAGLIISLKSTVFDYGIKGVMLNDLFGPIFSHAIYLLAGVSLIILGSLNALGFPLFPKKMPTIQTSFAKRMKGHRR